MDVYKYIYKVWMRRERMTLETVALLHELKELMLEMRNVLYEVKGYLGFQESKLAIEGLDPKGEDMTTWDNTTEDEFLAHEVQETPKPYWERVGNDPNISQLKEGDENIKLICWIDQSFKVEEKKTDKWEGRFANLILSDGSGTIKLTMFNEQCDQLKGLKKGSEVKVRAWKVSKDKKGDRHIVFGAKGSIMAKNQEALE